MGAVKVLNFWCESEKTEGVEKGGMNMMMAIGRGKMEGSLVPYPKWGVLKIKSG
ncbi:hypothetical protein Hanom_Chr04g00349941 [Helianthus anomalus]